MTKSVPVWGPHPISPLTKNHRVAAKKLIFYTDGRQKEVFSRQIDSFQPLPAFGIQLVGQARNFATG
jgi:hypothetical protein